MASIKIELYEPGATGLGKIPKRIYVPRNQIPAVNRGILKGIKGINTIRVHEGNIFQVAGYNLRDGMYCYLANPDGTLAKSF